MSYSLEDAVPGPVPVLALSVETREDALLNGEDATEDMRDDVREPGTTELGLGPGPTSRYALSEDELRT